MHPKALLSFALLLLFGSVLTEIQPETATTGPNSPTQSNFKVFTVATERTDGYERYIRSARVYDIEVTTLGLGEEWKGGNMLSTGGGFKVNLLRKAIEPFKDEKDTIILFTDSYDVVFTSRWDEILRKFKETGARVLFSAEKYCWPNKDLAKDYPKVPLNASAYLNSGGFIGYASELWELISEPIEDTDDDQLYYTMSYLNAEKREKLGMQLDTESRLFQNLFGAKDDVKLNVDLESNEGVLQNVQFMTQPSVIHGNGWSKIELNAFANYLAQSFNSKCLFCQEKRIELDEKNLPVIMVSLFVTQAVPFFDVFLQKIEALNYPKNRLHLLVYVRPTIHDEIAGQFVARVGKEYLTAKLVASTDAYDELHARQLALQRSKELEVDYLFNVDGDAHLDDPEVLREMLITNKQFIAPVVTKYNELWSNFWGALSDSGYYARSVDYVDIVKGDIIGMWNVPYVSSVYLIKNTAFKHINYQHKSFDPDMAMCDSLRIAGVFMYVTNVRTYGHLVNMDNFDATVTRPDFYTIFSNKIDWTRKYIHPNYLSQLDPNATIPQPCTDVFWFQIATDAFCDDMVAIMENYGKWSSGKNTDERLEGGYEAVPTRDIHMKQVGLDPMWLEFLQLFVRPLQEKVFAGYFHNPPRSLMNFVVRYRPDEQPSLRPHHDSSTYTINIALNRAGIDYEGGGCRFIRYNCSVTATKKGWMLMHPGRLTHFHEGLLVTNGTRYIMISFIDP